MKINYHHSRISHLALVSQLQLNKIALLSMRSANQLGDVHWVFFGDLRRTSFTFFVTLLVYHRSPTHYHIIFICFYICRTRLVFFLMLIRYFDLDFEVLGLTSYTVDCEQLWDLLDFDFDCDLFEPLFISLWLNADFSSFFSSIFYNESFICLISASSFRLKPFLLFYFP